MVMGGDFGAADWNRFKVLWQTNYPRVRTSFRRKTLHRTAPPTATGVVDEPPPPAPSNKRWYVVKVQSGREESIKEAIERRVKIEGIEEFFGQIIIPVEKVTEVRSGKRVVKERKLYPGYLMAEVEYNDRILYLFRETSGVGDFVGGGVNHPPQPMPDKEVERMLGRQGEQVPGIAHAKPKFDRGDRVKVKDGTFAGMEGEVKELLEAKGAGEGRTDYFRSPRAGRVGILASRAAVIPPLRRPPWVRVSQRKGKQWRDR